MRDTPTARADVPSDFARAFADAFSPRYEIVEKLGQGAHGVVYRAIDTMLSRDVAIKQVRFDELEDVNQIDEVKRRTRREARMAAKLRHPNIVAIYDIVYTDTSTLLIMEFVDGVTLDMTLRERRRLNFEETMGLVPQIANALDHAHTHGVVHRDVKPANLMITEERSVKIADFGIAKSQRKEMTAAITATGIVLGTPHYMSPEQARGQEALDGRSDLFSLGCIEYECLSGNKPFSGNGVVDVLLKIVNGGPDELNCDALGLHPDIKPVLAKALAKKTCSRYQTAAEFIEALRAVPAARIKGGASDKGLVVVKRSPVVTRRDPKTSSFDIDLHGSLSDNGLAEILKDLQASSKTGILHLQQHTLSKRLYLLNGSIVFANSDDESDRLGQLLLKGGVIDEASYERALRTLKRTGRRLGETLVEQGILDEPGLAAYVNTQIQRIIWSVFSWKSCHYRFNTIADALSAVPVVRDNYNRLFANRVAPVLHNPHFELPLPTNVSPKPVPPQFTRVCLLDGRAQKRAEISSHRQGTGLLPEGGGTRPSLIDLGAGPPRCFSMFLHRDGDYPRKVHANPGDAPRGIEGGATRSVLDDRHKYARYFSPKQCDQPQTLGDIFELNNVELFEPEVDPNETHNLAIDPRPDDDVLLANELNVERPGTPHS